MHLQFWIMYCLSVMVYAQVTQHLDTTQKGTYLQKQWLPPMSPTSSSIKAFILFRNEILKSLLCEFLEMAFSTPGLWAILLINHSACVCFSCVLINTSQCLLIERTVYPENKHLCYVLTIVFFWGGEGQRATLSVILFKLLQVLRVFTGLPNYMLPRAINIEVIYCSLLPAQWLIRLHLWQHSVNKEIHKNSASQTNSETHLVNWVKCAHTWNSL